MKESRPGDTEDPSMAGPLSEPPLPSLDELRALAKEAIAASPSPNPLPANASPNLVVGFGVAERCRTLMQAILVLTDSGLGEIVGIVVRTLYEDWMVGIYALRGGTEAMDRLVAQQQHNERLISKGLGQPVADLPSGGQLPVKELAAEVTRLLEETSHRDAEFARSAYETLYRLESHHSAHGGLGSLIGIYVVSDGSGLFRVRPPEADDEGLRIRCLLAVMFLVSAAHSAALTAGLENERLDRVVEHLKSLGPSSP